MERTLESRLETQVFVPRAAVSINSIPYSSFYHMVFGTSLHFQYRDTGGGLAYGNPALEMSRAWGRHTVAPAPIFEALTSNLKALFYCNLQPNVHYKYIFLVYESR